MSETLPSGANVAGQGTAAAAARELDEAKDCSDDRADRIAKLRRGYEEGSYRVDAGKLSKRIIDKHLRDYPDLKEEKELG